MWRSRPFLCAKQHTTTGRPNGRLPPPSPSFSRFGQQLSEVTSGASTRVGAYPGVLHHIDQTIVKPRAQNFASPPFCDRWAAWHPLTWIPLNRRQGPKPLHNTGKSFLAESRWRRQARGHASPWSAPPAGTGAPRRPERACLNCPTMIPPVLDGVHHLLRFSDSPN